MNTLSQMNTTVADCGPETFAGSLHTARSSGRKLPDILGDICDESLKKIMNGVAKAIVKITQTTTGNKIRSLVLSDNILNGFEGIDKEGNLNPFNATYSNPVRHAADEEWSEHGKGLISALKAACDVAQILTRYKKIDGTYAYEECTFNFEEMADDNRHSPICRTVSQEYYNQNHPFETGSTITLSHLQPNIFTGTFDDVKNKIHQILVDKYSSALIIGNQGSQESRLKFKVQDSQPIDIVAIPSPLENENHPHEKFWVRMEVRESNNGNLTILLKKEGGANKWHAWSEDRHKFVAIKRSEYDRRILQHPNVLGVFTMGGTRTSGRGVYQRYPRGHPMGSLVLKRLHRALTEDVNNGGRHMSFLPKPKNGEFNYHYLEMNWVEKRLTKLIEHNLQKKIDCDLTRLNSLIAEAGKWAEKQIRDSIKSESRFKKDWNARYHMNMGEDGKVDDDRAWDGTKTYEENLANAEAALEEYNNAQLSSDSDNSSDSDSGDDNDSDDSSYVGSSQSQEDNGDQTLVTGGEQGESQDQNQDQVQVQDQNQVQVQDQTQDQTQDQNQDQNTDSDNSEVPVFVATDHLPETVPVAATTHATGITLETYEQLVDWLKNQNFTEDQKAIAILGNPSENIKGLKWIGQTLLRKHLGSHYNLVIGMHWSRESTYGVTEWANDIALLAGHQYNVTDPSILTGSDLSKLVVHLQSDNVTSVENQLEVEM